MNLSSAIRAGLLLMSTAVLAGCSFGQKSSGVTFPGPAQMSKEQWSDAMVILTDMGLSGRRDIPRNLAEKSGLLNGTGDPAMFTVDQLEGSDSIGTTVFMVGGSTSLANLPQVAAWVPTELAGSIPEAMTLVTATWQEARKKVLPKSAAGNHIDASLFMNGQLKLQGKPLEKIITSRSSHPAPSFIDTDSVIGPIFIPLGAQLTADAKANEMSKEEAARKLSNTLPNWFFIYQGGSKYTKPMRPPGIYNQGRELQFIAK